MRLTWIRIHLYIAAFFTPMLLTMAISGGLYLLDIKGNVEKTDIDLTESRSIDTATGSLEAQVRDLLVANGIDHEFEYIRVSGNNLVTRPTSTTWYQVQLAGPEIRLSRHEPDLIARLVELHKGHGPGLFKNLQKVMALGLLVVLLSGLWLGLTSPALRLPTAGILGAGLLVFLVLGFT